MGFFSRFRKEKPEERNYNGNTSLASYYGQTDEGIAVTEENVLRIPTVKACVELISGTVAQLPINLYKESENGSIEKVSDDNRTYLLNEEPNEYQTGYSFKKHIVKDYLLHGCTYSYLEKTGNDVLEIIPLSSEKVSVDKKIKDGFKVVDADINLNGMEEGSLDQSSKNKILQTFKPYELIIAVNDSSDGLKSKGILHYGKDVFKVAIEEKKYTSGIYRNGALPLGVLKTSETLTEPAIDRLKTSWNSLYAGFSNAGKTVILEEGLDYHPVSLKPGDLLLTENRKDTVSDICKLFNLPESLIDVTKIRYGSLEQNNIHYLQYTLSPTIASIENGINKALLLESEKREGYFFAFDTSEVLRSTDKERYESVEVAMRSGVMSVNEARNKLNLPSIKDNIMKWSLGSVLYNIETGEMIIPNMGIGVDGYDKEEVINQKKDIDMNAQEDSNNTSKINVDKDKTNDKKKEDDNMK